MADLRYVSQVNSPAVAGESDYRSVNGTRDGAIYSADYWTQLALEGRVYVVNVGTGTSPTTFNATYSAAEPDLWIHVPTGTAIIPIYLAVGFEDTGTAQVMDVLGMVSSTGDSAVTGTALTIKNSRTDAPNASVCTASAVVTAAGTDPHAGNFYEFWRPYAGFGEDAFNGSTGWVNNMIHGTSWSVRQAAQVPIVANGGSLAVYAAGQAATGFIVAAWAEVPSTRIQ